MVESDRAMVEFDRAMVEFDRAMVDFDRAMVEFWLSQIFLGSANISLVLSLVQLSLVQLRSCGTEKAG